MFQASLFRNPCPESLNIAHFEDAGMVIQAENLRKWRSSGSTGRFAEGKRQRSVVRVPPCPVAIRSLIRAAIHLMKSGLHSR
jgi:hypothetical protein